MLTKIDHLGIAVKSLAEARKFYEDVLGLQCEKVEEIASQKARAAFFTIGDIHIELLEATAEDSPIAKFITAKGEGFHHVAYESDNIVDQLQQAKEAGCRLIHEEPTTGAGNKLVAFLHPQSSHGVLTEFCTAVGNKKSEEALRRSEKELHAAHQSLQDIIDFLPDATFVIDRQGKVVAWNHAIETMTGMKAEDILGLGDFAYALPFYGKRRPILIDLVEDQNPQLKTHYDVHITNEHILHAEAYVSSAYGNKGAYLSGIAAPLFDHKGNHVGAIESIRDISEHKQAEETLRQRTRMLEETNTALKVLLRESGEAKEELERKVMLNMRELILPYVDELEGLLTDGPQRVYLQTIKTNLHEITSSFSKQLSSTYNGLTPKEIQIADFIRQGKSNKEMAYLLKVSINTIDFHRRNLRRKVQIKGEKTNLRSFLLIHTAK